MFELPRHREIDVGPVAVHVAEAGDGPPIVRGLADALALDRFHLVVHDISRTTQAREPAQE
jgi:hypothetical protein